MRIIKKETLAGFLLCLIGMSSSYAEAPCSSCPTNACGPCGEVLMNAGSLPSDATGVNPLINYTATAGSIGNSCNRGYFSGFFFGGGFGIGRVDYDLELDGFGEPLGLDSNTRSYSALFGDVGFNLVLCHFLLGLDVGYIYRSRNDPISFVDVVDIVGTTETLLDVPFLIVQSVPGKVRFDISSRHGGYADLTPGFVYGRFAAYLRLGVEKTKFDFQQRFDFPFVTIAEPLSTVVDENFFFTQQQDATGFRAGLGFGIAATQHISFHLNYVHTFYKNLTYSPNFDLTGVIPVIDRGLPTTTTTFLVTQLTAPITIHPSRGELNFAIRFRL